MSILSRKIASFTISIHNSGMEEFSFKGRIRSLTLESVRLDTILPGEEEQRLLIATAYFDEQNRLQKKQERNETILFEYNADGLCERETCLSRDGQPLRETLIRYDLTRKLSEESGAEKKEYCYNKRGQIDFVTTCINGIQESVTSFNYDEHDRLIQKEIRDPEGNLLRSCRYKRNGQGLITEEKIINQNSMVLEHNFFQYPVFHQRDWLKRVRCIKDRNEELLPVEAVYRGISLTADTEQDVTAQSGPVSPPEDSVCNDPEDEDNQTRSSDREEDPSEKNVSNLRFANGSYRGQVNENDRPQGFGIFEGSDGSLYKGEFSDGLMNGMGDLITADGRHYRGSFKDNLPHGEGECLWTDGSNYRGSFRNGRMHGIGVFIWADGRRFTGLFDNNKTTEQGLLEDSTAPEEIQ